MLLTRLGTGGAGGVSASYGGTQTMIGFYKKQIHNEKLVHSAILLHQLALAAARPGPAFRCYFVILLRCALERGVYIPRIASQPGRQRGRWGGGE